MRQHSNEILRHPYERLVMAAAIDMSWVVSPSDQFEQARERQPDRVFPEPPKDVVLPNKGSALLLHTPRASFEEHWKAIRAPEGYEKYCSDFIKFNMVNIRLAPKVVERTEPVWVIFDPEHGRGQRPEELWGNPTLASSEIFSAVEQFPGWMPMWNRGDASIPYLSGYRVDLGDGSFGVLTLILWGHNSRLELYCDYSRFSRGHWASPSVREC